MLYAVNLVLTAPLMEPFGRRLAEYKVSLLDNCESGILTSNISDHFFVFGFFDNMKIIKTHNYTRKRDFTEKNIAKFTKKTRKTKCGII